MVETVELETLVVPEVLQLQAQAQVHLVLRVQVAKEVRVAVLQALQDRLVLQFQSQEYLPIMQAAAVVVAGFQLQLAAAVGLAAAVQVVDLVGVPLVQRELQTREVVVDHVPQVLVVLHLQVVPVALE
jgi:hypothetical protein